MKLKKINDLNTAKMFWLSLLLIALVIFAGTIGYSVVEGWGFVDSLYMTLIMLTTVGYSGGHELTHDGEIFTIFLIVFGVGTVAYSIRNATRLMLEGELTEIFGRRKVEQKIKHLKDHYIVCGFGRMGRLIAKELASKPVPFVVIEKNSSFITETDWDKYLIIQGDADKDDVLLEAGVMRAKGLITVVSTDADNLYIVLTARGLNPELFIVARSGEDGSEKKLLRAGASKVISPYLIGADRMAQAVLRPAVVDFLEFATKSENLELRLEEVTICPGSKLAGVALKDSGIRLDLGIIVVAIKRSSGNMEFNPDPDSILEADDCLIALGQPDQMKVLEGLTLGR
jgi:voltage-gated potassium channel